MTKFVIFVDIFGDRERGSIRLEGYLVKLFKRVKYGHCLIGYRSPLELRRLMWNLQTVFERNCQRCKNVEYRFANEAEINLFLSTLLYDIEPMLAKDRIFCFTEKVKSEKLFYPYPVVDKNYDYVITQRLLGGFDDFRSVSEYVNPLAELLDLVGKK